MNYHGVDLHKKHATISARVEAGRDLIQNQGARCAVIGACRSRIIRDSWQKTDRRDAANLSLVLLAVLQNQKQALKGISTRPVSTAG